MKSFRRRVRAWQTFGALGFAFLLGSLSLSLFPSPHPPLQAMAELVAHGDVSPAKSPVIRDTQVRLVALRSVEEPTGDWNQWGGSPSRNNVPVATGIPVDWHPGEFDRKTGEWLKDEARNIKWVSPVGSQTYGNPVVADGRIYVGTNNSHGYLKRYPADVDLGCLLCFQESDGKFLWQHSSEKLKTGRVHDWPLQGICCAPLVEGKRLWFVSSRGEVVCCDTEGFYDGENDGPYQGEEVTGKDEADVVWTVNMMGSPMNISQHNMCSCSVTAWGDILLVNTSNGVDESHINIPAPDAPSFIALDKNTGELLWTDKSPGLNILHGQWSSPTVAELGGVVQALFAGGDGWLYSFRCDRGKDGKPELLWKFDCNPKDSEWILGGRGTRNNIIATPVVHEGLVYVAVGQDPEHGEGQGHLWCIDPTKRGDVSPQLAVFASDHSKPVPQKRLRAIDETKGETAIPNPNSAAIWHYDRFDQNGDGEVSFEEEMHRSCGTVAIKDDLLYISDFSGLFHCLDAKTGKVHWTYDMFAQAWGSPLIVGDKVYIGDEDGDIAIFNLAADRKQAMKEVDGELFPINADENGDVINMGNSVYSTPIVANGILYIANRTHLFAISPDGK